MSGTSCVVEPLSLDEAYLDVTKIGCAQMVIDIDPTSQHGHDQFGIGRPRPLKAQHSHSGALRPPRRSRSQRSEYLG
jgi:hypothetical protein